MKRTALLLALGLPFTALPQSTAEPDAVPVEATSYHVPVFRNEHVTVLNVLIPSQRSSGYHRHSLDTVAVLMSDSARTNQALGANRSLERRQPRGTVSFTPYARDPLVHTVAVQGEPPFHNIVVELLQPSPGGFSPGARAQGYTQVLDNERVRAWRLVLEPGQAAPAITQRAPGVRVVVEGGELVESVPGAPDRAMAPRHGEIYWQDARHDARRAQRRDDAPRARRARAEVGRQIYLWMMQRRSARWHNGVHKWIRPRPSSLTRSPRRAAPRPRRSASTQRAHQLLELRHARRARDRRGDRRLGHDPGQRDLRRRRAVARAHRVERRQHRRALACPCTCPCAPPRTLFALSLALRYLPVR